MIGRIRRTIGNVTRVRCDRIPRRGTTIVPLIEFDVVSGIAVVVADKVELKIRRGYGLVGAEDELVVKPWCTVFFRQHQIVCVFCPNVQDGPRDD